MSYSSQEIWTIIIVLGIGTFLIRFSFLGLIGDRKMPDWILRHLRYTPVAILPGMVAPLILWPTATDGVFDIPRFTAAVVTVAVGYVFKGVVRAILAGAVTLYVLQNLLA